MVENNQNSGTGSGKSTYQQKIGDSLVRGDITQLILLESNFYLSVLCLQADQTGCTQKEAEATRVGICNPTQQNVTWYQRCPIAGAEGRSVLSTKHTDAKTHTCKILCRCCLRPRMLVLSTALQTFSELDFLHLSLASMKLAAELDFLHLFPASVKLDDAVHKKNECL